MKKYLCLLLSVLLLLTVVGCRNSEDVVSGSDTETGTTKAESTTVQQEQETENTTVVKEDDKQPDKTTSAKPTRGNKTTAKTDDNDDTVAEDAPYASLPNRNVANNEWRYVEFAQDANGNALFMPIPSDWSVTANGNGFTFSSGGKTVGTASYSMSTPSPNTYLGQELNMNGGMGSRVLYKKDATHYTWVFSLKAKSINTLYFSIDYTQLSLANVDFILDSSRVYTLNSTLTPAAITSSNGKILLAGDESVAEIAAPLSAMLTAGGKNKYTVLDATVAGGSATEYAKTAWIQRISDGEFGVVILGGFKTTETGAVGKIRDACKSGGAKLVFLLGQADTESVVKDLRKTYAAVSYLNWKDEFEALVSNGTNKADLYSSTGVSTALGGYVGAHMIYRSVFGEVPPTVSETATAKAKLGHYVQTGHATKAEALYVTK